MIATETDDKSHESKKPIDVVRDNAPRIVGALRLSSDIAVASSLNPYWLGFGAFAGTSRNEQEMIKR